MPSSARCTSSRQPPSQRQRKEKQFNAMTTPTPSAPSATGRQYQESQKSIACPKASPNRRLHRYADPRRARRATAPERAQAAFSFGPCTARFLFRKTEKKMGGCIPLDKPPCGSRDPVAAGRRPHPPPYQGASPHPRSAKSPHFHAFPRFSLENPPKLEYNTPAEFQFRIGGTSDDRNQKGHHHR